uniref:Uncharacterized protein n=1 Tax=Angiostrongylus cantonensis TaxID=6313 RepID=A0A0K0D430_ANGCA
MVACRVRDRRELNTIKRGISPRPPDFSISRTTTTVVGQADKYIISDQCPIHPMKMVRLSFSKDGESPVNSTPVLKHKSAAVKSGDDYSSKSDPPTDDAGYDTIGTPRLTDNASF